MGRQKSFIKIALIVLVMVLAGAIGYFVISNKRWSLQTPKDKTWVKINFAQCQRNPWEEDWLKSHNNSYASYPSDPRTLGFDPGEIQIIKNYYNNNYGIIIYDVWPSSFDKIRRSGESIAVCQACGCPGGYALLLVDNADIEKMLNLNDIKSFGNRYEIYNNHPSQ